VEERRKGSLDGGDMDNYIDLRIFKSDIEEALLKKLTDEQFKDVIFESKDTLMNEIRTAFGLMYDDLKHIWVEDPNQMEMDLS
ncbi:uncharacterized protein METZ01_LOCUS505644, partial [marine metagenome]